jgi:hypothetical protein
LGDGIQRQAHLLDIGGAQPVRQSGEEGPTGLFEVAATVRAVERRQRALQKLLVRFGAGRLADGKGWRLGDGALILGERLDWRIAVALVAGFLGMLFIVGGKLGGAGLGPEVLIGAAAVLFSAVAYALNIIMLRHRATRDPLAQIILFQNVGPTLILLLPALWVWVTPTPMDLLQFAICGTLGWSRIPCSLTPSRASRRPSWHRSATSRLSGECCWASFFC